MPALMVIDAFGADRAEHELHIGTTLAAELMRLFPAGIAGQWHLYDREVDEAREIPREQALDRRVEPRSFFVLVHKPGTPEIWINLAISTLLTAAAYLLTPKPRRPAAKGQEEEDSGTNQLAGQSNVLRPGARVPELLGSVRCYPDLLTAPIELWTWPKTQFLDQWFVVGTGRYSIAERKLGDTPLESIRGASALEYPPGKLLPAMRCVRASPTVDNISLNDVLGNSGLSFDGLSFNAAAKTMSSPQRLGMEVGLPINIEGTLHNNGDFFVETLPPTTQTVGPYVYTLDGPVADETDASAAFLRFEAWTAAAVYLTDGAGDLYRNESHIAFTSPSYDTLPPADVNRFMLEVTKGASKWRGRPVAIEYEYDSVGDVQATRFTMGADLYGAPIAFSPAWMGQLAPYKLWVLPPEALSLTSSEAPTVLDDPTDPLWTDWIVSPLPDPAELWFDIAFPQGLIKYVSGDAQTHSVVVTAEFRRVGTTSPVVARGLPAYVAERTQYLRATARYAVSSLYLPGSGAIEVRLRRTTPIHPDTSTTQYVDETRWVSFRAMQLLAPRQYPDVTISRMTLRNTGSAASLGENAYNMVATRVLPTWTGSAWSDPMPTARWADNFVARYKSANGANRPDDADLDVEGIYALQAELDALDDGAQGRISLAIDQQQDIDAELAQIADVIRAVVYRVGRKLFVTRDQANATPLALFNGRSKSADAESMGVRMKSDDEHDAILVQWIDALSGWKQRELSYPEDVLLPTNPLRIGALCANWPQAWRRAAFEWNKVQFRRERITLSVTEEGRMCRPGDVVHVTDDVGNLALSAGEVLTVIGTVLELDRDVAFGTGTHTILLRDVEGLSTDAVPCTAVSGSPNRVQLGRSPTVTIKGRDLSMGTAYSFYSDAKVTVRQWLLTAVEMTSPPWVQLTGANYSPSVYQGDAASLPPRPPLDGWPES